MASNTSGREATKKVVDAEVIRRARDGDGDAFGIIVETYRDRLFGLALGIVRNRTAAEDVVQEAFIKAYKNLKGFRGDSSVYTWLYRIAVNTAHNHLRRERRPGKVDFEEVAPVIAAKDPNPADRAANSELGEVLGVTEGAVKANFFHAIQKLKGALKAYVT
jgi:RNA polymerase sigma-70 factor (ECF subfamily)